MKISYRLLLITFSIIVVITVTSTLIFYSLTNSILQSKLSNSFLKSSYDFVFTFRTIVEDIENKYNSFNIKTEVLKDFVIDTTDLDYLLPVTDDFQIDKERMKISSNTFLNFSSFDFRVFAKNNPNLIFLYAQSESGNFYYGKVIDENFLNILSDKSRLEIILLINNTPFEYSHSLSATQLFTTLLEAGKELKNSENFAAYTQQLETTDFYATVYSFDNYYIFDTQAKFMLFTTNSETFEIRETMGMIMFLLIVTGIALAMIFVLLFTTKLRKQITFLNEAASFASKGNFSKKVSVLLKDELGKLAEAFNVMLTELRLKERREKEYSDFLTLLNQNPTISEIADESIKLIVKELGASQGAFYIVENDDINLISTQGISKLNYDSYVEKEILIGVIKSKNLVEYDLHNNDSIMQLRESEVPVNYLMIVPIIYYKEVIALIEIFSQTSPQIPFREYVSIIHDQMAIGITNALTFGQMKELVEKLRKLNEDYQNQNDKITVKNDQLVRLHTELKQKAEELEKEKQKAEELTTLKSQFLASVSHELRTPLNSIIGLTEIVLKDFKLESNAKQRLNVVLRNGQKLLGLINNILDYLKLESGKVEIKKESFLLSSLLKEIEQFFEPLIKHKNLEYIVDYNPDSDFLLVTDRRKLEQILINLIGNAIKFTENGFIKISITEIAQKEMKFVIEDSGVGIKKNDLSLIFEEFRQADGGFTRKFEGTGLGLTISKQYANLLEAELFAESIDNKGAIFTLLLKNTPFERVESYESVRYQKISQENNQNESLILIAEKTATIQLISDYLHQNNFNVETVKSINEIESYLARIKPAAIIVVQNLSSMDNWLILKKLKTNSELSQFPVIMLSFDDEETIGYGINVFDYHFGKLTNKTIAKFITKSKSFFQKDIKIILIISDKTPEFLQNGNTDPKVYYTGYSEMKTSISKYLPDIIFAENNQEPHKILRVINELKHDRNSKWLPVICGIPKMEGNDAELWNEEMNSIRRLSNHHPLDVLKIIRSRMATYFDDSKYESKDDKIENTQAVEEEVIVKRRILLVDDDPDALYTLGELLNEVNLEYTTAQNGVECLAKLNSFIPDLIFLDIMMPQMDGFETIKNIKNDKRIAHIPVIAITAHAMLENRHVVDKHGFIDLLTKPVNTVDLYKMINKYLGKNYE